MAVFSKFSSEHPLLTKLNQILEDVKKCTFNLLNALYFSVSSFILSVQSAPIRLTKFFFFFFPALTLLLYFSFSTSY